MTDKQQPEFVIQRLYIQDVSFESPGAPAIFRENLQPTINLNIQNTASPLEEGVYDVVLTATITASVGDKTVFLVEVKQAGIFTIKNIPQENMGVVLNVTCPTILFPYLRETVSDLVSRGGFQHFYLAPINFEALYMANLQQQKDNAAMPQEAIATH